MDEYVFNPIGRPGYGAALRMYEAHVPLADLKVVGGKVPLFVLPKGTTVVSAKCTVEEAADSAADFTVDIGIYGISTAGDIGTVVDADVLWAAAAPKAVAAETLLSPATTAHGFQSAADAVVVAAAKVVTVAAKSGMLLIELVTVQ